MSAHSWRRICKRAATRKGSAFRASGGSSRRGYGRRLLARPKEERDALCSDECEAAVLFRLVEKLVQDDPAHWEKELDYSYLWERLAGMFQFYSAHYRMDGADWIAEHAPRGGSMMRAAWEAIRNCGWTRRPVKRPSTTACWSTHGEYSAQS